MIRSRTIIATPPGATIKEQLKDRGLRQKEFASRMDMSEKHISKLVNGEVQLTADVATRLEMVLGVPAQFWSNLEANYREKIIKAQAENEMDMDIELLKKLPYNEMANNNWVPKTRRAQEKVTNLRNFFEVVRLDLLKQQALMPGIACKRLAMTEKSDYTLVAWAQKAKLEARTIDTEPIDLKRLRQCIPAIRAMTTSSPEIFYPEMQAELANCGVALVTLPHLHGSFLHGATFIENNKIVMGLTLRGRDADKFWFSLFHELAHALQGHLNRPDGTTEADESEADKFAEEILIPRADWEAFVAKNDFSRSAIILFAQTIGIAPGIVLGRLQKEAYVSFSAFHDLKTKYAYG